MTLFLEKVLFSKSSTATQFPTQVRKRPLNKKETARKEEHIVTVIDGAYLTVHQPKLKTTILLQQSSWQNNVRMDSLFSFCHSNFKQNVIHSLKKKLRGFHMILLNTLCCKETA